MFHRFTDQDGQITGQGSIQPSTLKKFIETNGSDRFFSDKDLEKFVNEGEINDEKICLTFDDGLMSQFTSAKPILDSFGIKCLWFIYTKIFDNEYDISEMLNYFVAKYYKNFEEFYTYFFKRVGLKDSIWSSEIFNNYRNELKQKFRFYSEADIRFRFVRNYHFKEKEFDHLIHSLIKDHSHKPKEISEKIWMKEEQITQLQSEGHEIGVHSHSHFYDIKKMPEHTQRADYKLNSDILTNITGSKPKTAAHPLGSYDKTCLKILNSLDIRYAFRSNSIPINSDRLGKYEKLLLPRIDGNYIETAAGF